MHVKMHSICKNKEESEEYVTVSLTFPLLYRDFKIKKEYFWYCVHRDQSTLNKAKNNNNHMTNLQKRLSMNSQ